MMVNYQKRKGDLMVILITIQWLNTFCFSATLGCSLAS